MNFLYRLARCAAATFFALLIMNGLAAAQTGTGVVEIDGRVVDAQTGLPLAGASVTVIGQPVSAVSDKQGAFTVTALPPGIYTLRVTHNGYQPSDADNVTVIDGTAANVTLSLQAAPTGSGLTTIGRVSTTSAGALQSSSTIYRSLDSQLLIEGGTYRAGDALRGLPALNNGITGDTAALGDDLQLDLRGIGTLETLATLDGHPIAYGVPGGYNYQLSPVVGLRNINVVYGSGTNLDGYSAIGGSVDFQTLDPTPDRRVTVSQGYGQYDKASTQLQLTGSLNRFGYAFGYGIGSLDGPLKNDYMYQPGAAFDQSAVVPGANPAVRDLGVYKDDSTAVSRSGLAKLTYAMSPASKLTFTGLASFYWNDKTGNGDGDFNTYQYALAAGEADLAGYTPQQSIALGVPVCPAGTFVALNANGQVNGYGPPPAGSPPTVLGPKDGGITCQTPQQYAQFNTGYQGAGTAWQTFNFGDYRLGFRSTPSNQVVRADIFTNRYLNNISRLDALPFVSVPGTSLSAFYYSVNVAESGANASDTFLGRNNDIGLGYSYLNTLYSITSFSGGPPATPTVGEYGFVLHDIYHPDSLPFSAFFDGTVKRSTATDTSSVDPRLSLVYRATGNDVVRLSAGATTTQPSGDELDHPFVENTDLTGAGGGAGINCSANSIGNAPSTVLRPERGVDEEFAYGHRFGSDSRVQLTMYNTNIYDKLFQTSIPLSQSGTGFIDPSFLAQATARIAGVCGGTANAIATEQVTGTFNVGQERARGAMLTGRQRLAGRTFVDYDYTIDSTALVSAPVQLLQGNVTLIPGAQLARLPLHTFIGSLDQVFGRSVDLRYTVHTFSSGNTKSLPAYNYSELRAGVSVGPGLFSVTLTNLFNQWANIQGLRNVGVPLALNQYATPADYAPQLGTAATEQFGLPYRTIFFNYAVFTR